MLTELGKFLRIIRMNTGENAADMAKKLYISASYLYLIENGERKIPQEMERDILSAYSLTESQAATLRKILSEEPAEESGDGWQEQMALAPTEEKSGASHRRAREPGVKAAVCWAAAMAVLLTVATFLLIPYNNIVATEPERITAESAETADTLPDSSEESVDPSAIVEALNGLLSATLTEEEAEALRNSDLPELREKIRTLGDALLFLDGFDVSFMSGATTVYSPSALLRSLKNGQTADNAKYTFLAGYFLADTIPGIKCIYTGIPKDGIVWPYAALLIPTDGAYLILSPGLYSQNRDNANCNIPAFRTVLTADTENLRENLYSTGISEGATVGTVYVFSPGTTIHNFSLTTGDTVCDTLTPFCKKQVGVGLNYSDVFDSLYNFAKENPGFIAPSLITPEWVKKITRMASEDFYTVSEEIKTVSDAVALLLTRGYCVCAEAEKQTAQNVSWHYRKSAPSVYESNYGDAGGAALTACAVLAGDYGETGLISVVSKEYRYQSRLVFYVKENETYTVFDLSGLSGGSAAQGSLFSAEGKTLEEAFAGYAEQTEETEVLACAWQTTDRDIPIGWNEDATSLLFLPAQDAEKITVIFRDTKVYCQTVSCPVYRKIENDR